jgi:glutaminyl-peptide cyclotransferase
MLLLCSHALVLALLLLICSVADGHPRSALRPRAYTTLAADSLARLDELSNGSLLDFADPKSLLSGILVPRPPGSESLAKVRGLLKAHFASLGWHEFEDVFTADTPRGPVEFTNLVFTHDPTSEHKLVLAAHLDSKIAPENFVGATDSAAPCAMLADVALALDPLLDEQLRRVQSGELLQDAEDESRTTLQIVFFDGEEAFEVWTKTDSIYGSRCYLLLLHSM